MFTSPTSGHGAGSFLGGLSQHVGYEVGQRAFGPFGLHRHGRPSHHTVHGAVQLCLIRCDKGRHGRVGTDVPRRVDGHPAGLYLGNLVVGAAGPTGARIPLLPAPRRCSKVCCSCSLQSVLSVKRCWSRVPVPCTGTANVAFFFVKRSPCVSPISSLRAFPSARSGFLIGPEAAVRAVPGSTGLPVGGCSFARKGAQVCPREGKG